MVLTLLCITFSWILFEFLIRLFFSIVPTLFVDFVFFWGGGGMSSNFYHSYHSRLFGLEQSCVSLSGSAVMLSAPGGFPPFRLRTALFVRCAASLGLVCFQ